MSTSFFFAAAAVAGGISQFLTRAYLLLNSIQKKIEDDPEGKLRDEFQGQILAQKNHSREIRPCSELIGCPSRIRCQ